MRVGYGLLLSIGALLAAPCQSWAADGWQKLKWGMSLDEVKRAYPEATQMGDRDVQGKSPRDQRCLLQMPYEAANIEFMVRICFSGQGVGTLQSVHLDAVSPFNYYALRQSITDRYGKPEQDKPNEILSTTTWRDGNTVVETMAITKPSLQNGTIVYTPDILDLSYRAATGASNSGL